MVDMPYPEPPATVVVPTILWPFVVYAAPVRYQVFTGYTWRLVQLRYTKWRATRAAGIALALL